MCKHVPPPSGDLLDSISQPPAVEARPKRRRASAAPSPARTPSTNESLGMIWWNRLSERERAKWLGIADSAVPADAWAAFKRTTAQPAPEVYRQTDVTPEALFSAWSRREKESAIELLIASLDAEDGDPDREDGGDAEPTLGAPEQPIPHGGWSRGGTDDCEADDSDYEDGADQEGDTADDEASLGWTVDGAQGLDRDLEQGATVSAAQVRAARQRWRGIDRLMKPADGRHVGTDWGPMMKRRLVNLSNPQRAAVAPRLNRREVSL